mgnify:FL=1|jgi:phage terminase large subunit-like protein
MGAVNSRGASAAGQGVARRVGIIGLTYDPAREVMVFGDSGIIVCAPRDSRQEWIARRKMLRWPNGAQATLYSAFDPEALRGPQFGAVWADELAKWKQGQATWDMVELCLRLGRDPRASMTMYLRNLPVMRDMLERGSTAQTHATTFENAANLAPAFLEEVQCRYGGTRQGRQDLDGVLLSDAPGALWSSGALKAAMVNSAPVLDRIIVAVDPPRRCTKARMPAGLWWPVWWRRGRR